MFALDAIQIPMSLQEPVYNDGGDALYVMDQLSDQTNKEEKWVEDLSLEEAMKHLDERERYIIKLRFFQGRTQMEVAKEHTDIPGSGQQAGEECVENYAPVPYLRAGAFLVLHF